MLPRHLVAIMSLAAVANVATTGTIAAIPAPHVAPASHRRVTNEGTYKVGDRVEWTIGGIVYPGTIYEVVGDRYRVERDGYGRTSDLVATSDLRRLPGTAPVSAPTSPSPTPVTPTPTPAPSPVPASSGSDVYQIGDRVEWTIGGIVFPGTIYAVQGGLYRVERDGYGRTSDLVPPADLRRIPGVALPTPATPPPTALPPAALPPAALPPAALPPAALPPAVLPPATTPTAVTPPAATPPPATIPIGLYECQLYLANSAIVGRIRIVDGNSYTGLSATGSGAPRRFSYDQGSGTIDWIGGLQGFKYTHKGSALKRSPNGKVAPFMVVNYQIRDGGNINTMSCARIGS